MKLILTQEVSGLGTPGDVVEVKDGYARNFLLPRRFGTPWTTGGQKQVDAITKARASRAIHDLDHVTGRTEARNLLGQNQFHRVTLLSGPSSSTAGAPSHGRS